MLRKVHYSMRLHHTKSKYDAIVVPDPMQHSGSTKITAHRAITENLVTFSDIEDLQQKNQKLIAIVRQLSGEKEEKEDEERKRAEETAPSTMKSFGQRKTS